jgi:hypothetical protein
MKKTLLIVSLFISILCSCESNSINESDTDSKWWIIVHPTHGNSGIYLYNETNSEIEKKFELPEKLSSPHAIDFDGESLWVGGYPSIFELSPLDGTVLSEIKNVVTEGIASSGEYLYYSDNSEIFKIKKDGTPIESYSMPTNVIQDIAFFNSNIYYVVNGENDPIIRYNKANLSITKILDTEIIALYTLAIKNNCFILVTDKNEIRRFDINTLDKLPDTKINIDGWITGIAPY